MSQLLLDEMFSDSIAQDLRAQGHDVVSIVADPALIGLPDDQVLAYAAREGRVLVTANIKGLRSPRWALPRFRPSPRRHDLGIDQDFPSEPRVRARGQGSPRRADRRQSQNPARTGTVSNPQPGCPLAAQISRSLGVGRRSPRLAQGFRRARRRSWQAPGWRPGQPDRVQSG